MRLSMHALRQMERRAITRAEVAEALASGGTTHPSADAPHEKLVVLGTTRSGRRLKIVTLTADREYVVTVAGRDDER